MDAFEFIRTELIQYDLESVAEASGICQGTLINWIEGKHKARFTNLVSVAYCLGYNIEVKAVKIS